jgi:ABC-2 type transport system ATP-binding protein
MPRAMAGELALEVRDIAKRFGRTEAVRGVSFDVAPGEVFGLLGPNGAGKSTTLRVIAGLARPDVGSIRLCGHDLATHRALALSCAGFLIETPALPAELTCAAALRYVGLLGGGVSAARIDEVLKIVGLADAEQKTFRQLSLGMKQRLGIGAALLGEPQLVVLDEPLNGLDPAGIREMSELMRGLAGSGVAVLLSSHLLDEVQRTAHRVAVMDKGKVVAIERVSADQANHVADLFFSITAKGAA